MPGRRPSATSGSARRDASPACLDLERPTSTGSAGAASPGGQRRPGDHRGVRSPDEITATVRDVGSTPASSAVRRLPDQRRGRLHRVGVAPATSSTALDWTPTGARCGARRTAPGHGWLDLRRHLAQWRSNTAARPSHRCRPCPSLRPGVPPHAAPASNHTAFEEYTTHRGHQDQAHAPGQDARAVLPHRRRRRPHQARRPLDRDDRQVPPEGGPLASSRSTPSGRSTGSASARSRPRPSPRSSG